jgi:hypothetical protein
MTIERTPIMYLGFEDLRFEVLDVTLKPNKSLDTITIWAKGMGEEQTFKARKKDHKLELLIPHPQGKDWVDFEIYTDLSSPYT